MSGSAGWQQRAGVFAAALWWGSLTAIGFIAVPVLFARLPTPAQAGNTAAVLFAAQTWVSLVCGILLLFASRAGDTTAGLRWARGALAFVLAGVLLALLSEFGVAPHIVARDNLRLWHSVGSAMYFVQWLCAGVALWKVMDCGSSPQCQPVRSAGPS
jgi:hypothetical protein